VPLWQDIEHLTKAKIFCDARQVLTKQNQIRQNFVALVLKVVLGKPHRVDSDFVGGFGPSDEILVALDDAVVAVASIFWRYLSGVIHWNCAEKVGIYSHSANNISVAMPGITRN
jgi:hypothetical protein